MNKPTPHGDWDSYQKIALEHSCQFQLKVHACLWYPLRTLDDWQYLKSSSLCSQIYEKIQKSWGESGSQAQYTPNTVVWVPNLGCLYMDTHSNQLASHFCRMTKAARSTRNQESRMFVLFASGIKTSGHCSFYKWTNMVTVLIVPHLKQIAYLMQGGSLYIIRHSIV